MKNAKQIVNWSIGKSSHNTILGQVSAANANTVLKGKTVEPTAITVVHEQYGFGIYFTGFD